MKLSDSFTIPDQVMAQQVGEDTVILDLPTGIYYALDAVGARLWALLSARQTLDQACETLLSEFEVPREELELDVLSLVTTLLDKHLLITVPSTQQQFT